MTSSRRQPPASGTERADLMLLGGTFLTMDAARQCRAESVTGSVEVGKDADLGLLEDGPTGLDPMTIAGIGASQARPAGALRSCA